MSRSLVLAIFFGLCSGQWLLPLNAAEQGNAFTPDIRWIKNPSPPFHILDGHHKSYGICDVLVEKLNDKLSPLSVNVEVYPQSRVRKLIEGTENLCFPCMIKRQDTERFVYSERTTVYPPLGIIMSKQRLAERYPDAPDALSLAELLDNRDILFGFAEARRFPAVLQTLIDQHSSDANVVPLAGVLGPVRVLTQIHLDRIQYTLDYPGVLRYFSIKEKNNALTYLPTTEYGEEPVYGAIGCTNNEWGKKAVNAINSVLSEVLQDPEYIENQQFWLNSIP